MSTLNGNSLLSGISTGLTGTYSVLANASGTGGVTMASILSARNNSTLASSLNPTFASYIQTNFSTLDKNHDGTLSSAELSSSTSMMTASGMTRAQLAQFGSASGMSTETLSQVLDHFMDIDTNGDGKVTSAEINAYNMTSAKEKKATEFRNKFATDMSIMYADDTAGSTPDSSSLLSYKYLNDSK